METTQFVQGANSSMETDSLDGFGILCDDRARRAAIAGPLARRRPSVRREADSSHECGPRGSERSRAVRRLRRYC